MNIFFDLDGTLLDVSNRHYSVYSKVTKAFNGKPLTQKQYWSMKKNKTTWPKILLLSKINGHKEEEYIRLFIKLIEDEDNLKTDKLFRDAIPVLTVLCSYYDCYLISLRRNPERLLKQLEWLNIDKYFKKILSGHSEYEGYDTKIKLLKSLPYKVGDIVVGDTEADVKSGQALGLVSVGVLSGIRSRDILEELSPDYLIDNISQLPDILAK